MAINSHNRNTSRSDPACLLGEWSGDSPLVTQPYFVLSKSGLQKHTMLSSTQQWLLPFARKTRHETETPPPPHHTPPPPTPSHPLAPLILCLLILLGTLGRNHPANPWSTRASPVTDYCVLHLLLHVTVECIVGSHGNVTLLDSRTWSSALCFLSQLPCACCCPCLHRASYILFGINKWIEKFVCWSLVLRLVVCS